MKKINLFVLMFVIAVLLSIAAFSQLSPIANVVIKLNQITPTIALEQKETCTTSFYDEVQGIYGDCAYYSNYTHCLNTSGPNTGCSLKQDKINFQCKTGEITVRDNRTVCKPDGKFIITIDKGAATLKKQMDYSDWGPCIYNEENNCLIVTCVSLYDGAHQGKFIDCKGGKSCQRFEICDNSTRTLYKNSREDFMEDDPTFHLNKLAVKEVEE